MGLPARALLVFAVAGLAACSRQGASEAVSAPFAASIQVPGVFQGDLPCADCPGIRHTLELLPDNRYVLRREYLERASASEDDGHWHVDEGRQVLVLEDEQDAPAQWQIESPTRLRMLDMEGQPIASGLNYTLTRRP